MAGMSEPVSLGTFGDVQSDEDLSELDARLDKPPVEFTLVGYGVKRTPVDPDDPDGDSEHARHEFVFHAKATMSFGQSMTLWRYADSEGKIGGPAIAKFLGQAVVAEEQDEFWAAIMRSDIDFEAEMLAELAKKLGEMYAAGPSAPRSARRAGSRQRGPTTGAARLPAASR